MKSRFIETATSQDVQGVSPRWQDLVASSSEVQCVMCGQLFGSGIDPMQSCVVPTQPYKWLRMEFREVKIKVSTKQ